MTPEALENTILTGSPSPTSFPGSSIYFGKVLLSRRRERSLGTRLLTHPMLSQDNTPLI